MGFNYGVGDSNGDFGFTSYEADTAPPNHDRGSK